MRAKKNGGFATDRTPGRQISEGSEWALGDKAGPDPCQEGICMNEFSTFPNKH